MRRAQARWRQVARHLSSELSSGCAHSTVLFYVGHFRLVQIFLCVVCVVICLCLRVLFHLFQLFVCFSNEPSSIIDHFKCTHIHRSFLFCPRTSFYINSTCSSHPPQPTSPYSMVLCDYLYINNCLFCVLVYNFRDSKPF